MHHFALIDQQRAEVRLCLTCLHQQFEVFQVLLNSEVCSYIHVPEVGLTGSVLDIDAPFLYSGTSTLPKRSPCRAILPEKLCVFAKANIYPHCSAVNPYDGALQFLSRH